MCPPVSPCKGASIVHPPCTMRIFFVWKRRCADVRAGTQAPPLRVLLERIVRGCPPLRFRLGRLRLGGFVCWENGAQEPTPSVLYFCQPRVAADRRLPWGKSWRGTYAIGIVLFKINLRAGNHSPRVVMMCDEKEYNPQGGSLLACTVTQGRLRCTCQPCAIESTTPMR